MNFENYLKTSASEINQELETTLKKWQEEVNLVSPKLVNLNKAFVDGCQGGKRLRGALVMLGYDLAKTSSFWGASATPESDSGQARMTKADKEILKPAVAFEIFQTAILAHDDIIDKSDTRRGVPTLWKILGGDHRAISHTIVLSDIGFFLATQLIADSKFPDDLKNKAVSMFTKMVINTGVGELLDVELPYLKQQRLQSDVLAVQKLKTADYTITYPLSVGAILGGADEKLLKKLNEFGEKLGIAFQIQDDILGVFGDEKTLGKSVTSDIEEGKNTLLIIEALKKATPKQKKFLDKYYGKGKIGEKELEEIRQIFIETGALEYSNQYAEKLVKEAKKLISQITTNSEHSSLLTEMADFLVKRDK